jgi:peptidoglycan/LPS O-acetylase OafA/YrhL
MIAVAKRTVWRPRVSSSRHAIDNYAETGRIANNFDLLRLFAAIFVVFGHSFDLLRLPEPLGSVVPAGWGYVGVLVFFSISGFLVSRSWVSDPRLTSFAIKRALRLLPALVVALVLSALVLGPLVSTESSQAYFQNPATKGYIIENAVMQSDYQLPGVFLHNPYPAAVNGSLWTLPLEVKAYTFLALLGFIGLLTRGRILMIGVAALGVVACVTAWQASVPGMPYFIASLVNIQVNPVLVHYAKLGAFTLFAEMFAAFTVGAALFALRRWIPLVWQLGLCAAVAWGVTTIAFHGSKFETSTVVLAPYIVLCLAYLSVGWIRLPRLFGDYSYGIYIYAFPIQQTVVDLLHPSSGWILFVVSLPITFIVAVVSWHAVESRALDLKRRLVGTERGVSGRVRPVSPPLQVRPLHLR